MSIPEIKNGESEQEKRRRKYGKCGTGMTYFGGEKHQRVGKKKSSKGGNYPTEPDRFRGSGTTKKATIK